MTSVGLVVWSGNWICVRRQVGLCPWVVLRAMPLSPVFHGTPRAREPAALPCSQAHRFFCNFSWLFRPTPLSSHHDWEVGGGSTERARPWHLIVSACSWTPGLPLTHQDQLRSLLIHGEAGFRR